MASPELAMRLLMTDSYGEGERIALELEELNRERQRIQQRILEDARRKIVEELPTRRDDRILVLADEDWPAGVIGIVASHIVEEFYRPTVMISLERDMGRGSARSIPELNIVEALTSCRSLLDSFGGHAQAAGLRLPRHRIDALRAGLNEHARTILSLDDLKPKMRVDGELLLDSLSRGFVGELRRLAPFGQGAPEPVMVSRDVHVAGHPRRLGPSGKHLSFHVSQGRSAFRCIAFGMGELAESLPPAEQAFHIAFAPTLDNYSGRDEIQLRIKDIHLPVERPREGDR
jgi:single-stranded-DNA-specific exonuclease